MMQAKCRGSFSWNKANINRWTNFRMWVSYRRRVQMSARLFISLISLQTFWISRACLRKHTWAISIWVNARIGSLIQQRCLVVMKHYRAILIVSHFLLRYMTSQPIEISTLITFADSIRAGTTTHRKHQIKRRNIRHRGRWPRGYPKQRKVLHSWNSIKPSSQGRSMPWTQAYPLWRNWIKIKETNSFSKERRWRKWQRASLVALSSKVAPHTDIWRWPIEAIRGRPKWACTARFLCRPRTLITMMVDASIQSETPTKTRVESISKSSRCARLRPASYLSRRLIKTSGSSLNNIETSISNGLTRRRICTINWTNSRVKMTHLGRKSKF